jgi:hypothetical protein
MNPPLAAANEWCCCVTAVAWSLGNLGRPTRQEDIITKFKPYFPDWDSRPGLISRCDLLRLLEMNELHGRKYIQSDDKDELCSFFSKNYRQYLCGFVQTRNPTNHCMAVAGLDGNFFLMMDCDRTNPKIQKVGWDFLASASADMLLVFTK